MTTLKIGGLLGLGMAAILGSCTSPPQVREASQPLAQGGWRIQQFDASPPEYTMFTVNYHRRSGCYKLHSPSTNNQQIRFHVLFPSGDRAQWDLLARTIVASCTTTIAIPRKYSWYGVGLPLGQSVMVAFKSIPGGNYGYIVIKHEGTGYYMYTTTSGPYKLEPGTPQLHSLSVDGSGVTLVARNPAGERSWLIGQDGVLFSWYQF